MEERIMKTTMLKLCGGVCLCTILLIGMWLLLGCDNSSAPDKQNKVRQPAEGEDLEEFWNGFDWADLTQAEQALWEILGWDEASWQGEADEPASESKKWSELTDEERSAAEQLGYDETYWDALP
jgi:hypothetical protein